MKKRPVFVLLLALCGMAAFAQNVPRVVVLPLENRVGESREKDVETLTELLSAFINETRRINVIDRMVLEATMEVRGWQMKDWGNISKTAEIGRALNAQYILRGTLSPLDSNLLVSVRILDINTAEVKTFSNMQLESMSEAYSKMNSLSQLLIYTLEIPVQPEPVQSPVPETPPPATQAETPAEPPQAADPNRAARLNTLGVSAGTAFADPLLIITVRATFAPVRYLFLEAGVDFGFISMSKDVQAYYSLYPFAHIGGFLPLAEKSGWYIGAGAGYMFGEYTFFDEYTSARAETPVGVFAVDFVTGLTIGGFDISYTARTDFSSASNKISIGYTCRFK